MPQIYQSNICKGFKACFNAFLKWNKIFQFSMFITVVSLGFITRNQSDEINNLNKTKAYLIAQDHVLSKSINELILPWWKKEYFVEGDRIIMQKYNDEFYRWMLKPLKYGRYHYVNKSDFEIFNHNQAQVFYDEDLVLVIEFLKQTPDENGNRPIMQKEYNTAFNLLTGELVTDGYWRYVRSEDGHIYIYGIMKSPIRKPVKKEEVISFFPYLKPNDIKIKRKKQA